MPKRVTSRILTTHGKDLKNLLQILIKLMRMTDGDSLNMRVDDINGPKFISPLVFKKMLTN